MRRSPIFLGPRLTSLFSRFAAKAIDLLFTLAIFLILHRFSPLFAVLVASLLAGFADGFGNGQSVGKRIIGLRVIDDSNGVGCSLQQSFLRNIGFSLVFICAAVPVLWVILVLLVLPILLLEVYLLATLETGVRLGDVLGNTLVQEHAEDSMESVE